LAENYVEPYGQLIMGLLFSILWIANATIL